jgi:hypothetical protein
MSVRKLFLPSLHTMAPLSLRHMIISGIGEQMQLNQRMMMVLQKDLLYPSLPKLLDPLALRTLKRLCPQRVHKLQRKN